MATQTTTKKQHMCRFRKYAGNRLSVYLDEWIQEAAKRYLATTRHRTISGFLDAKLKQLFRADAPKLRKQGIALPEALFQK